MPKAKASEISLPCSLAALEELVKARPENYSIVLPDLELTSLGGIYATKAICFCIANELFRNEQRGNEIVQELKEINPEGEAIFLPKDISLLRNVDELCEDIKRRESKIHCLFLTAGYMTLKGQNETIEGIDRKMCVNYYFRIRCTLNLMPLLEAASHANELSRVITVLAAGSEGDVRLDDLDLKHNFTLHACLAHCVVMTDFAIEELSRRFPGTSFSHVSDCRNRNI